MFPGPFGHRDYSGFIREEWIPRANTEHRRQVSEINKCCTIKEKEAKEALYGTRYSVLTLLPYFDCIKMVAIDGMHNLFLGTSKKMIEIWKEKGFLDKDNLKLIQERVDKADCPSDVGKLPSKIDKFSFEGFTGDECKNWTIIFSMYALKDILPSEHLACWQQFVLACCYLCNRFISQNDIIVADQLLIKFCKSFERLYGEHKVTPNMPLHGHLAECLYDYGPFFCD